MRFILKTTDIRHFTYVAAGGSEPLRNYRKTMSLLQSRLHDTYPDFASLLATPAVLPDGNIEWSSEAFSSLPRPLDKLTGEEHSRYSNLLRQSMVRLQKALAALPSGADTELFKAIATVPSEETIFCADGRIAIAEWGLRPASGGAPLSLLSFADMAAPVQQAAPTFNSVPQPKPKDSEVAEKTEQVSKTEKRETVVPPVEIQKPVAPPVSGKDDVFKVIPPVETPQDKKENKKKRAWLWILIGILCALLVFVLVMLLTRCSSTESVATLPVTSPEIKNENVVLSDDSMTYVVNNRLNIMVLDGGTLDDFIKDFRKEFPDKKKYVLSSPDTVLNHLVLTLPPEEVKEMKVRIPEKMKPKYKVIVATEGMNGGSYIPADPAMKKHQQSFYFDMINAPEAWDIQRGNPNLIVAVLDDGFDMNHPEIKNKTVKPYDIYRNKPGTQASTSGHGQHTSGTAVGTADNNSGACGVAPDCRVMPVNVFNSQGAPDSLILKGLVYAAKNGAKVVSISIGRYFGPQAKFLPVEQQRLLASNILPDVAEMYDEVFRQLDEMGISVVLSAGNETVLAQMDPMKRSSYPIVVSAVDSDGDMAIFDPVTLNGTNWGERCDISAPGVDIYNAIPGGYDYMSGTSMACPQVAGGVALVYSQYPNLTPQEVKKLLVTTAVPTDEHIGPLMDLAAAMKADPSRLPENPSENPAKQPLTGRGKQPSTYYTDPYSFFFVANPNPSPRTTPGKKPSTYSPNPDPMDCAEAAREMQKLQEQYEALVRRYGACM